MLKLTAHVTSAMFLGDLIFILLGRSHSTEGIRYLPVYAAMAYLFGVAVWAAKLFSYSQLFKMSVVSSLLFIVLIHLMGELWFPGTVKFDTIVVTIVMRTIGTVVVLWYDIYLFFFD